MFLISANYVFVCFADGDYLSAMIQLNLLDFIFRLIVAASATVGLMVSDFTGTGYLNMSIGQRREYEEAQKMIGAHEQAQAQ